MASPRNELIDLLAQGERSVEDLSEASRLSIANASQHPQQPRRGGLSAGVGAARALEAAGQLDRLLGRD